MMQLITPPIQEPLSLEQAKAHCRVDFNDDDIYIESLITTARQSAETYMRVSIMPQTRLHASNEFKQINYIPYGPVQAISNIKYLDRSGDEQVLDPSLYKLHRNDDYDYFTVSPNKALPEIGAYENGLAVQYQCGYATVDAIPKPILQAMLLHIGDMYENRERNILTLRFVSTNAYEALLAPHVRMLF